MERCSHAASSSHPGVCSHGHPTAAPTDLHRSLQDGELGQAWVAARDPASSRRAAGCVLGRSGGRCPCQRGDCCLLRLSLMLCARCVPPLQRCSGRRSVCAQVTAPQRVRAAALLTHIRSVPQLGPQHEGPVPAAAQQPVSLVTRATDVPADKVIAACCCSAIPYILQRQASPPLPVCKAVLGG